MDGWPFRGVHDEKINAFKEKYVVNLYLWIGLSIFKMTPGIAVQILIIIYFNKDKNTIML